MQHIRSNQGIDKNLNLKIVPLTYKSNPKIGRITITCIGLFRTCFMSSRSF